MNKKNYCLNFFKGIGCIGVVFMHWTFPGTLGEETKYLFSWVVPMFFMIAGFYLYQGNLEVEVAKTPKKIWRTAKITGIALVLYYLFLIIRTAFVGDSVREVIGDLNIKNVAKLIILNDTDFTGAGHLWFMVALLYAYITFWIFGKIGKVRLLYPCMIVSFLGRGIVAAQTNDHHLLLSYWFSGFLFFFFGYWIRQHIRWIASVKSVWFIVAAFSGIVLHVLADVMGITTPYVNIFEYLLLFSAMALFLLAQKYPDFGKGNICYKIGEKYSMNVYLYHIFIRDGMTAVERRFLSGVNYPQWYWWGKPILIVIITLLLCLIIEKISNAIVHMYTSNRKL